MIFAAQSADVGRVVGELGRLDAERGEGGDDLRRDRRQVLTEVSKPPEKLEGYGYGPSRAEVLPTSLVAALDALEADGRLADMLGGYFVISFVTYKRNQIERFERFVTDWEFREYAYHL